MPQQTSQPAIADEDQIGSSNVQQFLTFVLNDEVYGIGKIDEKLMILLDVDHVLAINELSQVVEISEELNSPPTNQVNNG